MAEFKRRKRFLKYNHAQCKKFLSRDFERKCAYCKIREGDLAGPENFEKDHFLPVSKGGKDDYDNLYYCCTSCNGKSGKSDIWSKTLLDPCKYDIWNVHVVIDDGYKCKGLTNQGWEYIKTFKLNRKSYITRRRIIGEHQKELIQKIQQYEELVKKIHIIDDQNNNQIFEKDIYEFKQIIENGANYRMSQNVFDEENDKLIVAQLQEVGKVTCVDKDYDLFYELEVGKERFLCNVETINIDFGKLEKISKYVSVEKIEAWGNNDVGDKVLLIFFNLNDKKVY